jgi:3-methyladenine DNA glycosylase AlkD
MHANNTSRDMSLSLYQFVCHHIVGSEETVNTKRTFNTINDNLSVSETFIQITRNQYLKNIIKKYTSEYDTKMSLSCGLINC